jgi:cytochrome c556
MEEFQRTMFPFSIIPLERYVYANNKQWEKILLFEGRAYKFAGDVERVLEEIQSPIHYSWKIKKK